jgi:16S rRNA (cytosine967-C5)-methyltransferase
VLRRGRDRVILAALSRRRSLSPQVVAVHVLRAVDRPGVFSNRALADQLERHPELEPGARGLVTTLVYGVLRHRARMDAHVDAHARAPGKLGPIPREVLRVGAYELRELGRPPGNAIAHAIACVTELDRAGGLRPLVHAVLSGIARDGDALDERLASAAPLDALERRWSIPRWLAGRWLKQLGPERALARARAVAEALPVDVRVDVSRIEPDDARARLLAESPSAEIATVPGQPQALRVRGGGDLFHGPLHDDGLVSVQGLAAQQPALVLAPAPGEHVLDACAGLGVKTLQLAELMHRRGSVVAADIDARKLAAIDGVRARGRLDGHDLSLVAVAGDLAGDVAELDAHAPFDAVLLDVPCTGLGNLARHPEIRWQRKYEDIALAADLQARLLARNLERVRSGGRLVYAVCSMEPEEGPARVAAVVASGAARREVERTWTPEDDATEGFYIARLAR